MANRPETADTSTNLVKQYKPTLSPKASSSSVASSISSSSSSASAGPATVALLAGPALIATRSYPSPGLTRRVSSGTYSSSPLSSSSISSSSQIRDELTTTQRRSSVHRRTRRQDSISSTLSSTDATSFEDSGVDDTEEDERDCCTSLQSDDRKSMPRDEAPSNLTGGQREAAAPPSALSTSTPSTSAPIRRMPTVTTPLSAGTYLSTATAGSGESISPSIGPSLSSTNALPISIGTSVAPNSVRLSTTPLFPSPLAQASGPEEEHSRGDEGDEESEENEDDGDGDDEEELLNMWDGRPRHDSSNLGAMSSPLAKDAALPAFGGESRTYSARIRTMH
ncbi:rim15, signal transduction response regulator [Microbotryomycetes sp. JL221]|nr:rim15, signal transduction response regulator [Microbotryomycetes sp. JL221]